MSIPLDDLYNWVESLFLDPVVLYVFRPHGSKKISNFDCLRYYANKNLPSCILNDQEPLDWNYYNSPQKYDNLWKKNHDLTPFEKLRLEYGRNFNLKSKLLSLGSNVYDRVILVHSEKNSDDLEKYQQNDFVCVHYWAHAIIARDWYRFANVDTRLNYTTLPTKKFLIYSRDWSGGREYRLKFLEMLVLNGLNEISQCRIMHTNSNNVHFSQHQFVNPAFELETLDLISCIAENKLPSTTSASYDYRDFINSEISVVLETVFDDRRIHLTEKILRPIACGHPFLLAAGPGSLEYIRSYGFKTFSPLIDESYDLESDSLTRLEKIIKSMKQIQNLTCIEKKQLKNIADYNKKHFFSDDFFNLVTNELRINLNNAYKLVKNTRGKHYLELLKLTKKHKITYPVSIRKFKTQFVRQLRQSYPHDPSTPAEGPVV